MRAIVAVLLASLGGCTFSNLFTNSDDFCQSINEEIPRLLSDDIDRELRHEPPNGALTKPYSRDLWDNYWNARIERLWDTGPASCNGKYKGPSGPEMIADALAKRRAAGLPEINLNERNRAKSP